MKRQEKIAILEFLIFIIFHFIILIRLEMMDVLLYCIAIMFYSYFLFDILKLDYNNLKIKHNALHKFNNNLLIKYSEVNKKCQEIMKKQKKVKF